MDPHVEPQTPVAAHKPKNRKENQQRRTRKQEMNDLNVTVEVDTTVPVLSPLPPREASKQEVFQAAFKETFNNGVFHDTKFFAFSRRTTTGTVSRPRAVFANSLIMRATSSHFEHLLSGGFAESAVSIIEAENSWVEDISTNAYDYWSDSDLEDEVVERKTPTKDATPGPSQSADSDYTPSPSGMGSQGTSSRSDSSATEVGTDSEDMSKEEPHNSKSSETPARNMPLHRLGRTILVTDVAFNTWQAMIFYVHTGNICFSPLRSQGIVHDGNSQTQWSSRWQPTPCSPKSIYRLADKYDLQILKDEAAKDIALKLSRANIFEELFSSFTSRYPEMMELELTFVLENCDQPNFLESLPLWIEAMAAGRLAHAGGALASLVLKLASHMAPHKPVVSCPQGCASTEPLKTLCDKCGTLF